ncbi:hypothetical protein ACH5RR_029250 [Cinchona calisaya]|uniref:Uncharacterized protein n=1 Tax=Cinchona calisaya TaxID=153742 RepID=A0ABD2YR37_9GENT
MLDSDVFEEFSKVVHDHKVHNSKIFQRMLNQMVGVAIQPRGKVLGPTMQIVRVDLLLIKVHPDCPLASSFFFFLIDRTFIYEPSSFHC